MASKKNNSTLPVWRNENGEIECPGNSCPQECDDMCPIYCERVMIHCAQNQLWDRAIEWGERILTMVMDEPVIWNNLGTAYGHCNDHRRAYQCYETALSLQPDYPQALKGLKVAEQKLIQAQGFVYTRQDSREVIELAGECSMDAYNLDLFPECSFPNVPELFLYLNTTPYIIISDMNKFLSEEFNTSVYECSDQLIEWSFYAGIGAVQLWHTAWTRMQGRELMEMFYEHVTINELDEYVFKITYGATTTQEVEEIKKKFGMVYPIIGSKFAKRESEKTEDKKTPSKLLLVKMSQVAYLLGCAYRLHEMGMH